DGPYFTDFLVNRMAIDQKIGEICPRPAEFSLRFFKSDRLLANRKQAAGEQFVHALQATLFPNTSSPKRPRIQPFRWRLSAIVQACPVCD
ncbi:MAG: hypothetical protein WC091_07715, partial [Sulfuricellaceae bacterium]